MAIFDRPKSEKRTINTIVTSILLSVILIIILLLRKSSQLSGVKHDIVSNVRLGPLSLLQVHKTPLNGDGYQASIKIMSGLFIYFVIWTLIVIAVIFIKRQKSEPVVIKDN